MEVIIIDPYTQSVYDKHLPVNDKRFVVQVLCNEIGGDEIMYMMPLPSGVDHLYGDVEGSLRSPSYAFKVPSDNFSVVVWGKAVVFTEDIARHLEFNELITFDSEKKLHMNAAAIRHLITFLDQKTSEYEILKPF